MAWDALQFRDEYGNEVDGEQRQTLLSFIEKGLRNSDVDPDTLIKAARAVCRRLGTITNLAAYANRTVYRAVRDSHVAERKLLETLETLPEEDQLCSELPAEQDRVEQQILVERMFEGLDGLDRQIFDLHLLGHSFREIDEHLRLKSRTSEYRFREAQSKLRKMLPPQR
jgi:DNA-directed RNA polymerase specialized sigma24 family protein